MLREEFYFIDRPFNDLVVTQYNNGTVVYDETSKEWTMTTTQTSAEASIAFNIGEFKFGDKVIFECDADNVSGAVGRVTINKVSSTGTVSYYQNKQLTDNANGKKKRVAFEVLEDTAIQIKIGVSTDVGQAKIKNIKVKKVTESFHLPSTVSILKAKIHKTSSGWGVVSESGSNECVVEEFDSKQLKVTFTERLSNRYPVTLYTMDYQGNDTHNLRIETAYSGRDIVNLMFRSQDGSNPSLSNIPNGTRFNLIMA